MTSGRSLIKNANNKGHKFEPWGTLEVGEIMISCHKASVRQANNAITNSENLKFSNFNNMQYDDKFDRRLF